MEVYATWGLSLQIVATAIPGHGKDRRTAAFISQQTALTTTFCVFSQTDLALSRSFKLARACGRVRSV